MGISPAVPGAFFCFAAMVLLIFVSVSVPVWNDVSFLDSIIAGKMVRFGVWGYTGSATKVGYSINGPLPLHDQLLETTALRNLTDMLVLHPVAAGLSFLAFAFGIWGAATYSRLGTILMTLISALAFLVTVIAFSIDMILFNIIGSRIRFDAPGNRAHLSNAIWLTLSALIILAFGTCAAGCGSFGRYRYQERSERV